MTTYYRDYRHPCYVPNGLTDETHPLVRPGDLVIRTMKPTKYHEDEVMFVCFSGYFTDTQARTADINGIKLRVDQSQVVLERRYDKETQQYSEWEVRYTTKHLLEYDAPYVGDLQTCNIRLPTEEERTTYSIFSLLD